MKKKLVLLLTTTTTLSVSVLALVLAPKMNKMNAGADSVTYSIKLDSKTELVEKDKGYLYQANIKNNKFDVIGYGANSGGLCTIAKKTHDLVTHTGLISNKYTFEGMIYNRSVINGFKSLTVKFSGGDLHYKFTDFLMEDMNFDGETNTLISNAEVSVPTGKAYFVVFNKSTTPVSIESLEVKYRCNGDIDDSMIYNKNTSLGGARSISKKYTQEDSFIELENNPTLNTNNHSTGNDISSAHPDAWYRWNGRYFTSSGNLGTEFTFGMTIVGNISQVLDETDYFHYNVWPQFSYGNSNDEPWVQTYIGNDNYEPLGKNHDFRPDDPYIQESFTGRFFTNYDWYDSNYNIDYNGPGKWTFADPDLTMIPGGSKTFREAYKEYSLPFWYLKFHVYLDVTNDAKCDIEINGTLIYSSTIFDHYDTVNTPSISIKTLPMHLINYAEDNSENPRDSYVGTFTYPRLITE